MLISPKYSLTELSDSFLKGYRRVFVHSVCIQEAACQGDKLREQDHCRLAHLVIT